MKKIKFQGMTIAVENDVGSVRQGKDKNGKPWRTVMTHAYGYIEGTEGVDGDAVDCFIGPDKSAKFAYVIHQLQKENGAWDEDKVMLGFPDAMSAKEAYFKNYDLPAHFYGQLETIPMATFKQKVFETKNHPALIHAGASRPKTKLEIAYELSLPVIKAGST